MTPTQRLAPILRWAAERAERGHEYEARQMCKAFEFTLKHVDAWQTARDIAHGGILTAECYDFDADRVAFAWPYAIAYVLLTEEKNENV